ncbi:MAG: type III pantothenate kinase [Mariniblastus sp.]
MQLIAADIGNSSTKVAIDHAAADNRWCMQTIVRDEEQLQLDLSNLEVTDEPAFWSVSSVNRKRESSLQAWISEHRPNDRFHLIGPDDVQLKTDVESRTLLGRDRLVEAWMAMRLNDNEDPIIVIDAGTAVTIDFVDQDAVFRGGVIFPGAESNFRMLAEYTDALPDLRNFLRTKDDATAHLRVIGKSTTDAIVGGVYQSQSAAIIGIVNQMIYDSVSAPVVFATGGGIEDIRETLPDYWNYVPDLVLRGAREIGRRLMQER